MQHAFSTATLLNAHVLALPLPQSKSSLPQEGRLHNRKDTSRAGVIMAMCRSRVLAALLALTMLVQAHGASAQGQGSWHTMTGPDRSFSAELPSPPKYTATKLQTGSGGFYTMHQYMVEMGDIAYVVQTAIYPPDVDISKPRINLQGGLNNAARNMDGGKWNSVDWPVREGITAYDAVGVRKGLAVRSYSAMRGRRIVTLTYAGPAGSARSPDASRFIDSLRFAE